MTTAHAEFSSLQSAAGLRRQASKSRAPVIDFRALTLHNIPAKYSPPQMIDLAATFEEHATEAAAMVWRVKRTPVALRDVVALATSKAQGIVLTEPEFLPLALVDGLRGLA